MTVNGTSSTASRFIPLRRRDLIDLCVAEDALEGDQATQFEELCRILAAVFHFEYHEVLERLKDAYAPFSPDRDTRVVRPLTDDQRRAAHRELVVELRALLDAANYEEVGEGDLEIAMGAESLLEVRLHVDFDDFEDVAFFRRGGTVRTETLRKLGGLVKREVEFLNYDRVLVYVHFKDRSHFEAQGRDVDALPFEPGATILKLFQDVPRPDLEMLFPNTEVRMRPIDKVIIGVPALVSGIIVVATKLIASLGVLIVLFAVWLGLSDAEVELDQAQLVGLGAGLGSVGAFLVKQLTKFKNRKIRFMKTLTDNLYFKNLDNDSGVLHHLLDQAEEEETKEAVLAYWWLLSRGPCTDAELDAQLESWLGTHCGSIPDFEVDDAVAKLTRLGLVEVGDDGRRRAIDVDEARRVIDRQWDAYFSFHDADARR